MVASVARTVRAAELAGGRSAVTLRLPPFDPQRDVMAAETEVVGERHVHPPLYLLIGRRVEIALGIGGELIDGRWNHAARHDQQRDGELERPGPAQEMTGH